jgi:hypothetical protein
MAGKGVALAKIFFGVAPKPCARRGHKAAFHGQGLVHAELCHGVHMSKISLASFRHSAVKSLIEIAQKLMEKDFARCEYAHEEQIFARSGLTRPILFAVIGHSCTI